MHIADAATAALPRSSQQIAILATEPTLEAGFYQQRIQLAGKTSLDSPELNALSCKLISLVKHQGYQSTEVLDLWHRLQNRAEMTGADALLIACTDLSALIAATPAPILPIIDTPNCLAQSAVAIFMASDEYKLNFIRQD